MSAATRQVATLFASLACLASLTACMELALHQAAKRGDTKRVLAIIDSGGNVNQRDFVNWTPLHYAAREGHADTVRELLDRGAEINARDRDGITPLHLAAGVGQQDVVRLLVERGADANAKYGREASTPARVAQIGGHADVAQYLREAEARAAPDKPAAASSSSPSPPAAVPVKPTEPVPPPIY